MFQDSEGTGTRDAGLGMVGRNCTFDFAKQQAASRIERQAARCSAIGGSAGARA